MYKLTTRKKGESGCRIKDENGLYVCIYIDAFPYDPLQGKQKNGKSVRGRTILVCLPVLLYQCIVMFYNILIVSSYSFMCPSYIILFLHIYKYSNGCDAVIRLRGWFVD